MNKMNKTKLIALMTGVVVTGLSFGSAHAEFVLGVQGGFSSSQRDLTESYATVIRDRNFIGGSGSDALGLFGQYRHALNNNVLLGVHLGYATDSAAWNTYIDGSYTTNQGTNFTSTSSDKYKVDYVYDVLGLVGYKWAKVTPFAMFGFSSMRVKASHAGLYGSGAGGPFYREEDDTLNGWKLAAGIEFPFSDKLVGHVLLHYADYGKAIFSPVNFDIPTDYDLKVKQTGIRFGIGYRF